MPLLHIAMSDLDPKSTLVARWVFANFRSISFSFSFNLIVCFIFFNIFMNVGFIMCLLSLEILLFLGDSNRLQFSLAVRGEEIGRSGRNGRTTRR